MKLLVEMALSRPDAIDLCLGLGEQFIKHYDKLYKEPNSQSRHQWLSEMNNWYNKVKKIKLKSTNNSLLNGQLRDWFFTAGANPEDFMNNPTNEEIKSYDEFITKLIETNSIENSINI